MCFNFYRFVDIPSQAPDLHHIGTYVQRFLEECGGIKKDFVQNNTVKIKSSFKQELNRISGARH